MGLELAFNGIQFECERQIPVEYRDVKIGVYRPDLRVSNEVVLS